jgi:hypothetical protein
LTHTLRREGGYHRPLCELTAATRPARVPIFGVGTWLHSGYRTPVSRLMAIACPTELDRLRDLRQRTQLSGPRSGVIGGAEDDLSGLLGREDVGVDHEVVVGGRLGID